MHRLPPLILSHDVNNASLVASIWPIISNTEAIAVNQAWAGFSGSVFSQGAELVDLGSTKVGAWQIWNKAISEKTTVSGVGMRVEGREEGCPGVVCTLQSPSQFPFLHRPSSS